MLTYLERVEAVRRSQDRLDASIGKLTEEEARGDSLLPGWTRGHVITHLARNADACRRMALGVVSGEPQEMYPGGQDARNSAIDEGADRPIALLAGDSQFSGARLLEVLPEIGPELLETPIRWRRPVTADLLPTLRWREIEIHYVDLGVGYMTNDWSDKFVSDTLEAELPRLADRAPGVAAPDLPPAELLAWLIGRSTSPNLPELPAWP